MFLVYMYVIQAAIQHLQTDVGKALILTNRDIQHLQTDVGNEQFKFNVPEKSWHISDLRGRLLATRKHFSSSQTNS